MLRWGDEERQIALEHHKAVHHRTQRDPKRPRYICIILSDLLEAESDPDKRDALLEAIYHAEAINRELMNTGYKYAAPESYAARVRQLREIAHNRSKS